MSAVDKFVDGKAEPLVSVIIPFYKQDAYLALTVKSVLSQNYPAVEIVVVDDGSPVPAASLLSEFETVHVVRTENQGSSAARNNGFRNSKGELLLFLDADDLLAAGAIEAQVRSLQNNPDCAISFGGVQKIDPEGRALGGEQLCRPRSDYYPMLFESNPIASPGAAMMRRSAFVEAGMFDPISNFAEDYWLYLRIGYRHPFIRLDRCILKYRSHPTSQSVNQERMLTATLDCLQRLEATHALTAAQQRALANGRRRWIHNCRPETTLTYRLRGLYFSFRAMLGVSFFTSRKGASRSPGRPGLQS